jgi:kinesin family member C2/C3
MGSPLAGRHTPWKAQRLTLASSTALCRLSSSSPLPPLLRASTPTSPSPSSRSTTRRSGTVPVRYTTHFTSSVTQLTSFSISVSRDLLSLEKEQEHPDFSLEIKVSGTGTYVDGLSEWPIRCYEEAQSLFKRAQACRHSLASASSSSSSSSRLIRSHFIVLIKVHRTKMSTGHTTTGQLYFVDLAGSERMKLGDATGGQLREAQSINKSLTALGDVMAGLAAKHKHKHIPYRNSKLTFLLQDVLRESARILMFINLTPSPVHTGESVASLQFGAKCRLVLSLLSLSLPSVLLSLLRSVHLGHPKKLITHYPNNR